jgi:hypothetical protein
MAVSTQRLVINKDRHVPCSGYNDISVREHPRNITKETLKRQG